jgi:ubiquinone/menaquinone biosynthesis C-methylase UbiE
MISPRILSRILASGCFGLLLIALPIQVPAQAPAPNRPTSTPYSGDLSIFETPGRDQRLQIQRVMDLLGIKSGSSVADLGAGSGWFTVRAAARVAPNGKVFAEDINSDAIKYIDRRLQKEKLTDVRTILGTPDDPKLPPDSVDALLMLKVYHEIAHPLVLLNNLKPALRPDAKIGIIDRNGNGADHGLNADVVRREMKQAGFNLVASYDFTKADGQDYFLIFQRK